MKYYLKLSSDIEWKEVTEEDWIRAERQAGFRPKLASTDENYMKVCATGGFSGGGVEGKIDYVISNTESLKPYFVKYLPIEGKLKEGEKVRYSKGELGFPDDIYTLLDNEKENMSAKGVSGLGIQWHKRSYKREDGKTVKESAYLKIGYNINEKDIQKVKLFLCSYDIRIGDRFRLPDENIMLADDLYGPDVECSSISDEVIHFTEPCTIGGIVHSGVFKSLKPFKVIGEISSEAVWVKEGNEFEHKDLIANGIGVNWHHSHSNLKFKVLCSQCATFH